jgi:hypothetical protein
VIRNVVMGRLNPGVELAAVQPALDAIVALAPRGLIACTVGTDQRLRDGTWDFAIVSDFADVESYRAYDTDDEHNRIRREMFAPVSAQIVRVQIEVP